MISNKEFAVLFLIASTTTAAVISRRNATVPQDFMDFTASTKKVARVTLNASTAVNVKGEQKTCHNI